MAKFSVPQININRSVAPNKSIKGKVNPNNPMTKGQARLLYFAVKELTGARLDLFSVNTPALVHSDITELCGILNKDSGATQDEQQLAIEILVSDLRVPVLESTPRPVSSAGRAAAAKAASTAAPEAGKVGIGTATEKTEPKQRKKMTPAESLAKARAAKKAKADAAKAAPVAPVAPETSPAPSEKTADEKLELLVSGLSALIKAVA
tara:strand:- start:36 stop:656 length:621 start_codon:yes stop_codon:yes gene_type:complete